MSIYMFQHCSLSHKSHNITEKIGTDHIVHLVNNCITITHSRSGFRIFWVADLNKGEWLVKKEMGISFFYGRKMEIR